MTEQNKDWKAEQERVELVIHKMNERMHELKDQLGDVKVDVVDIRKKFWDDVTVNFDNAEEAAETFASIKQQAELLSERERRHRHSMNELRNLHKLEKSPYFGRVDFLENGEEETERVYIGTSSFVDKNGVDFYVYDWRAPISSLYYDYGPGAAQYETPSGLIDGTMKGKKQYIIRNGELLHMFNTGITIGDEMLQTVLGAQADSQMKNIVATIQKEQNQIIRNEKGKLLIVQGVAGSGKTSAALQRVAYLLYRYRDTLLAENIVLFSPNSMFNSYVSSVLPELGEENMQQTTFQEYLEHRLGDAFTIEDPFSQMEFVLTKSKDKSYKVGIAGIQLKSSLLFMQVIDEYLSLLKQDGIIFRGLKFKGQVLFSSARIKEYFYSLDQNLPIPNRMSLTSDWLLKGLRTFELQQRKEEWVEREMELLDKEAYLKAYHKLQKNNQNNDEFYDFDREQQILAAIIVKKRLKKIRRYIENLQFVDVKATYIQLFRKAEYVKRYSDHLPNEWVDICLSTAENIEQNHLRYEDATPLLYLKGRLEGLQVNTSIRHVFIDEAQDYSPFQFAFIKSLFPRAKMTVLGDLNQSIYAHSSVNSFEALRYLFQEDEMEQYQLTRSYRSTYQIVEFTKDIIGANIDPFNRQGEKPTIQSAEDENDLHSKIGKRIKTLQANGHETIAIICKTAEETENVYEHLEESLPLRMITKQSTGYESGVLVIPSYLSKGVEFDAVIIYDASNRKYHEESERNLFYTACTRAMHSLDLFYKGELSRFLEYVPKETYRNEN
ncbi:RNA polymerase recycling motor HelD [Alkalihalobacterium chitinilyticum]|uniref:DNA 3'-5' helicase n=1 Tax=Alkalihalobacterium chitinilyticum TaxID=2980103 RepID=A0ABT5VJE8_9BACI|nr:RNA polymerase recycling motor HelD [Alkalihalobacterium chitinilyticum]MDE5415582.1 AAA family ATPase [Alkalihalobacterium chitinilyticum]